jgi:hypothetical protein
MKPTTSALSAGATLCVVVISAVCLLGAADALAKGGSPGWHGLTYHGAMIGTRGAYACSALGRALARPGIRICRTAH